MCSFGQLQGGCFSAEEELLCHLLPKHRKVNVNLTVLCQKDLFNEILDTCSLDWTVTTQKTNNKGNCM